MLTMAIDETWHLDDGEIERYSLSRCSGAELDRCDEHLLICGLCRHQVEAADAFHRAMRRAADQSPERPRIRRNWFQFPRLVPAFAALAALVLVAWFGARRLAPTTPPATILLTASRGTGTQTQAPAATPLAIQPDLSGLPAWPSYRLEVVDAAGDRLWQGAYPGPATPKLRPGLCFVRLYSPNGELYREYGLDIREPR